jgi:hypothetical protein
MPMDNRLMIPRRNYDADALRYLNAVQLADGQALEPEVQAAVDAFVRGCKADGIFSAIKASCILCGARTVSGALVPLAGVAPTPYNFASGDYSRTTGLKGNGSTKYFDSNRANDADGQNDNHNAFYMSVVDPDGTSGEMGAVTGGGAGRNSINVGGVSVFTRSRDSTEINTGISSSGTGLVAMSRSSGSGYSVRAFGSDYEATVAASDGVTGDNVFVFAYNNGGPAAPSDARLAFYSIGSSLDLAALDTRVSTLVASIAAAL